MTRITCPKGIWTEVATGVTNQSINLINYPDTIQKCVYKINYGLLLPAVDTLDCIVVELQDGEFAHPVNLNNSVAVNLYVMPLYDDGAVVI